MRSVPGMERPCLATDAARFVGEPVAVVVANDRWGQRGVARGAVVIIASDGWERGDATLLGQQMRRLSYLARRIVWVNPHRGKVGYAPVTAGMAAALPLIDDLVAGHTFEALSDVAELLAHT